MPRSIVPRSTRTMLLTVSPRSFVKLAMSAVSRRRREVVRLEAPRRARVRERAGRGVPRRRLIPVRVPRGRAAAGVRRSLEAADPRVDRRGQARAGDRDDGRRRHRLGADPWLKLCAGEDRAARGVVLDRQMRGSLGLALLRRAGDDFVLAEHEPVDETAECAVGAKRERARDVAAVDRRRVRRRRPRRRAGPPRRGHRRRRSARRGSRGLVGRAVALLRPLGLCRMGSAKRCCLDRCDGEEVGGRGFRRGRFPGGAVFAIGRRRPTSVPARAAWQHGEHDEQPALAREALGTWCRHLSSPGEWCGRRLPQRPPMRQS